MSTKKQAPALQPDLPPSLPSLRDEEGKELPCEYCDKPAVVFVEQAGDATLSSCCGESMFAVESVHVCSFSCMESEQDFAEMKVTKRDAQGRPVAGIFHSDFQCDCGSYQGWEAPVKMSY